MISVEIYDGADLDLVRISRFDSGVYLCVASNGVPPIVSKRVRLYVDCEFVNYYKYRTLCELP